ncbi:hypothetical protein GY21_01210 [Cryobacterium roopkundense]|uniref:Putative alkaline shock family protein YloU n=1 Tax=Cryobacterium roopkundense TaxID=1001240 RepID=A0A099JUH2_9MICO|nr:hypothetical protein [Cryobacterium roopkundense]KGJ81735.1 hypothetical protein GY21_01210 [Cryobacterium roopkundense]MBB5642470.1 putative alkaline shock family protein YloU [Cryobacterium roopkundense]
MSDVLPSTDRLDQIVLAVPGVDGLYAATPLAATVIGTALGALVGRPAAPNSVFVARQNEALSVTVKIGVADGYAAADVCRRVYEALQNHLTESTEQQVAEIAVTVARIG